MPDDQADKPPVVRRDRATQSLQEAETWWPVAPPTWENPNILGLRLYDYLAPKVHPLLKDQKWSTIIVKGSCKRSPPAILSSTEKRDDGFNWQRPTAERINGETCQLNCFPGEHYVRHHAYVLFQYFQLQCPEDRPRVLFEIPLPDDCEEALQQSNLAEMGQTDIVILGYLDHAPEELISGKNQFATAKIRQEQKMFSWHKFATEQGLTAAYLGCAFSVWGEVAGKLVEILKKNNRIKCVVYIGKAGCLDPNERPNEILATGSRSYVHDPYVDDFTVDVPFGVQWDNVLKESLSGFTRVRMGDNVTVFSPLLEDKQWLERWRRRSCLWVDCETVHVANAAVGSGLDFGYLEFVSDTLDPDCTSNLANEDDKTFDKEGKTVHERRISLFEDVDQILDVFLKNYK